MIAQTVSGKNQILQKKKTQRRKILNFSIHPKLPLLATSSGQRRFAGDVRVTMSEDEKEENLSAEFNVQKIPRENSVKIWSFSNK